MLINDRDQYFASLSRRHKEAIEYTNWLNSKFRDESNYEEIHRDSEERDFFEDFVMGIIPKMTNNYSKNIALIEEYFRGFDYTDVNGGSILHIISDNAFQEVDEFQYFLALDSLISTSSIAPNTLDNLGNNFIQTAVGFCWWSDEMIIKLVDRALKHGLDLDHVNKHKHTIIHSAIYGENDDVINICKELIKRDFDATRKDCADRSIVDAMVWMKQEYQSYLMECRRFPEQYVPLTGYPYTDEQIRILENLYLENCKARSSLGDESENESQYPSKKCKKKKERRICSFKI